MSLWCTLYESMNYEKSRLSDTKPSETRQSDPFTLNGCWFMNRSVTNWLDMI